MAFLHGENSNSKRHLKNEIANAINTYPRIRPCEML